ncbi:MAG TPA: hypothetical protein VK675_03935 [Candidatus Paceibacterota bacterium]|nr:hypothetical protein [Candidatus Paceibacterota bacterium]
MENEQEIEKVDSVFIEKKSFVKKVFSGIGIGGAVIGGGLLLLIFTVLRFLYIASAGLSMVWWAIVLFQKGSIVWGLVALIIGTPIAIGIASFLFIPLLLFSIVSLIIWSIILIFGIHTSFNNVWTWVWFVVKVLLVGAIAFFGINEFINSAKQKRIKEFFKENWFYFPLFLFLFWLFFSMTPSSFPQQFKDDRENFVQSLTVLYEASDLINKSNNQSSDTESKATLQQIYSKMEEGIALGKKVDDAFLDYIHPDLKNYYRNKFIAGSEIYYEGMKAQEDSDAYSEVALLNAQKQLDGIKLMTEWNNWWGAHNKDLSDKAYPEN